MAKKREEFHCLCVIAFGLACGIVWGLAVFILGLLAAYANVGTEIVALLAPLYIGYKATFLGSIIGAAWGFVDWFIGGVIIALLYNWICCRKEKVK